jgi:hypothetical protein
MKWYIDIVFNVQTVKTYLQKLNPYKAVGPDKVHPRVLREATEQMTLPVYLLCRRSMDIGQLPHLWKTANVIPLFKNGKRVNAENYRPFPLLLSCANTLKRSSGSRWKNI